MENSKKKGNLVIAILAVLLVLAILAIAFMFNKVQTLEGEKETAQSKVSELENNSKEL